MKKFKFKLDKVLKVRTIQEELAQNDLVKARNKAKKIRRSVEKLENKQHSTYNYLREKNSPDPDLAVRARKFINYNRQNIKASENKLQEQLQVVEKRRENLLEKAQNKKVLQKLKDKKANRFYREQMRKEQKNIDQIALANSASKFTAISSNEINLDNSL